MNSQLNVAARPGLAPGPCGLTNRRATLTPPGNGAAGRTPTCIVPFRRRMPRVFGHGSEKWSARQDLHLRSPGPKPGMLLLHHALKKAPAPSGDGAGTGGRRDINPGNSPALKIEENGGPEGACTLNPPADNGALCLELRVQKWWAALVTLQSSASGWFGDTGFTDRQPEHCPKW